MVRIGRLCESMADSGVDAFLAWAPASMTFLHGFGEGGAERFLTLAIAKDGRTALICPALSENQALRAGIKDIRIWRDGEDPLALFRQLAGEWGLQSAILGVDDDMPSALLLAMQKALPGALFQPGGSVLGTVSRSKDADELALLRKAGSIADGAFVQACRDIRPGLTERAVEKLLMDAMRDLGGVPNFCIVAAGANGAEPHHLTDDTLLQAGDVVIMDFGCTVDGYHSDITRTIAVGSATSEHRDTYQAVLTAHLAGRKAIAPGATCGSVDAATRAELEKVGLAKYFVHRTGHGIGLRIHEPPYLVPGSQDLLVVGDCVSVEPGVYLPGRYGIRIENICAVGQTGEDCLNAEPPGELLVLA